MMIVAHPGIEPGATPSMVGVCAAAILTDCQQLKNKNTWIMIFYSSRISIRDKSLSTWISYSL